jgi:uncharacterized protein YfdQ (DUF2303 family)
MRHFATHARAVKVVLRRARHYATRGAAQTASLIVFVSKQIKQNTKK